MAYDYNSPDMNVQGLGPIENELTALKELDDQLKNLVNERYKLIDSIKAKHRNHGEAIQNFEDWFEGNIRCLPVPERSTEVPAYDGMQIARRY